MYKFSFLRHFTRTVSIIKTSEHYRDKRKIQLIFEQNQQGSYLMRTISKTKLFFAENFLNKDNDQLSDKNDDLGKYDEQVVVEYRILYRT